VRSTASIALHVLRVLEDALIKSSAHDIILRTRTVVALYILNQKRTHLQALERRFGVAITVSADDSLTGTAYHALERGEPATGVRELPAAQQPLRAGALPVDLEEEVEEFAEAEPAPEPEPEPREDRIVARSAPPIAAAAEEGGDELPRSRRRRRRRGRGGVGGGEAALPGAEQPSDEGLAMVAEIGGMPTQAGETSRLSERGGRGGRRRAGRWTRSSPLAPEFREEGAPEGEAAEGVTTDISAPGAEAPLTPPPSATAEEAPAPAFVVEEAAAPAAVEVSEPPAPVEAPPFEAPSVAPRAEEPAEAKAPAPVHEAAAPPPPPRESTETIITHADPNRPKKGGWWQRAKASLGGE
jgi:ribonuclease E